jgi:hypothetical protein
MTFARRELSPAHLGRNLRLFLARRPWIRWITIGSIAAIAGISVHAQLESVDAARAQWVDRVRVPVATSHTLPGEVLEWAWREVPAVAVPDDVATGLPRGAVVRHPVGRGEIVVRADLATGAGPAAGADRGDIVVPISDPLIANPSIGLDVAVYSDGLVLAADGRIVHVETDVVFVAVRATNAPMVAAAAQERRASLAFLGPT